MTLENLFKLSLAAFFAEELWVSFRDLWRKMKSVATISQIRFRMLFIAALFLAFLTKRMNLMPMTGQTSTPLLIGIVLMWCGMALRLWSILTLGRFFRVTLTVQELHHVVTNGPYKYLRHPSYTGLFLVLIGLGIGLGDWLSLVAIIFLSGLALYLRILDEERLLINTLGSEYKEYAKHTKRVIPFIY